MEAGMDAGFPVGSLGQQHLPRWVNPPPQGHPSTLLHLPQVEPCSAGHQQGLLPTVRDEEPVVWVYEGWYGLLPQSTNNDGFGLPDPGSLTLQP